MADLNTIQATIPVILVGSDSTGNETTPVQSDINGNLKTIDPSTGLTASAIPTSASLLGAKDGTALQAITATSNGVAGNELLHIQAPDTTTTSTSLGALNATVAILMAGLSSVGFQVLAGSFIGTLVPECSVDAGTTWVACSFYDPANSTVSSSLIFTSANTTKVLSVLPIGGSSNVRVRVSSYTSGTANGLLRASQVTGAAGAVTAAAFGTVATTYPAITVNTATLILAANVNRKYAVISNNSGSLVSIQLGTASGLISAARGIVIPNNQYFQLLGSSLYTGPIYAFTNSSGISVSCTEGTP